MKGFPAFLKRKINRVDVAGDPANVMEGYVFDGSDGSQIVLWECPAGGVSPPHQHDFDEWAIVIEGHYEGVHGGQPVTLGPGDECFIPAGMLHEGRYSLGYRALDGFGGCRVKRVAR